MNLKYQNEDDRAYGLAGMAVSLAAFDAMDRIAAVSLDGDGPMVTFSNEYYFSGSPSISPKATWANLVNNFRITSAMVISNVMARSMVRMHRNVPGEILDTLRSEIQAEGQETCALEADEIDSLFDDMVSYTRRIFSNPRLHPAIEELTRILSRRRELSGREILEELHHLQLV